MKKSTMRDKENQNETARLKAELASKEAEVRMLRIERDRVKAEETAWKQIHGALSEMAVRLKIFL